MKTTTTKPRIDYTQLAAQLNYAALEQKLEQLRLQKPPKKRKQIDDVLDPVAVQLRRLRAMGWTYQQLSDELKNFGVPVKSAALRDYLTAHKPSSPKRGRKHDIAIT